MNKFLHALVNLLPDKAFLKLKYYYHFRRLPNIEHPKTFNEKLQWLKIYDRNPLYIRMVDKYEAKQIVSETVGDEYVIPTLGIYDSFDEIDFDSLPDQFVLKTTHDCGGIVICKDKSNFDISAARIFLSNHLKNNYYWEGREWPYKNAKPRIIAEQFMQDRSYNHLNVFKIFNFSGIPRLIQVIQNDKTKDETIDYFDTEWHLLELRQNYPNSVSPLPRPETLQTMLELAEKLATFNKSFLRTDFYEINGKVYFSEFTFFSDAGFAKFHPERWDEILGEWIHLPPKSN